MSCGSYSLLKKFITNVNIPEIISNGSNCDRNIQITKTILRKIIATKLYLTHLNIDYPPFHTFNETYKCLESITQEKVPPYELEILKIEVGPKLYGLRT